MRANELFGFWNQWAMQAYNVRDSEKLIEVFHLLAAGGSERLGRFSGRPHNNAHAECLRNGHHGLRNASKENKTQHLALRAMRSVSIERIPLAGLHVAVAEGDFAHKVEHEAAGVLRNIEGAVSRAVGG